MAKLELIQAARGPVYAPWATTPVQRAQPASTSSGSGPWTKSCRQADLADGEPGVALQGLSQVDLEVAVEVEQHRLPGAIRSKLESQLPR